MTRPTWSDYGTFEESLYPHLWRGCVCAWAPCLGPTGGVLYDMAMSGQHGALGSMDNATDWVVSQGAYALDFDGVNDYVGVNSFRSFNDATMCAWVYIRGGSANARILDFKYDTGALLGLGASTSELGGGFMATGAPYGSYGTPVANSWNFVAVTRIGTTNRAFINGSNSTSSDYTGGSGATTVSNGRIAQSQSIGNPINAMIDDIRLYNRPLSSQEIVELYRLGRGGTYARRKRVYSYQTIDTITGTAAITLSNFTASASGNTGTGLSGGFRLSQATSFPLSDSLSIG